MENLQEKRPYQSYSISLLSPIRADAASNRKTLYIHSCIGAVLILFCFALKLLPQAQRIQTYTATKWHQIQSLNMSEVNPFNRKLKIYVMATNNEIPIDDINMLQVYTLKDGQEKERKISLRIDNINDFERLQNGKTVYYLGDLHVLNQPFYRIKIIKFVKVERMLAFQEFANNASIANESEIKNQSQKKNQSSSIENEEQKKKEELQRQERQKQQQRQREKQRQKQRQKQIQKQRQEERQRQIQKQKTNLSIEGRVMTKFATMVQFGLNSLILLIIIYVVADNPSSPKSVGIILTLTSNPLLFIHLSYPNLLTNLIDSTCNSAPFLYLSVWIYYTHQENTYSTAKKSMIYLVCKLIVSLSLYMINIFRLLHYDVYILQTILSIVIVVVLSKFLWKMFLNLKQEEHRNKVLVSLSIYYFLLEAVIEYLGGGWKPIVGNLVCQIYGIVLVILMGKVGKGGKVQEKIERQETQLEEIKEESDRGVIDRDEVGYRRTGQ